MAVMRWFYGLVMMIFTLAFFLYVDIYLFIIGGGSDFLSGWDAIPQNVTTMVWGFVEIFGLGSIGALISGMLFYASLGLLDL